MSWLTNPYRIIPAVVIIAFLVNRGLRIKDMLTPYEVPFNDQNCVVKGSMYGAEDIVLGKESIMFIGESGSLERCFFHGSASVENGGMWMLDMKSPDSDPVKLTINNYPQDQALHVHGIYVSNKTDRMYLVNHLGPESTIEVLEINYKPEIALTYLQTVRSELFPRYGINDVIEGITEDEIYVTRWLVFSIPEKGASNPATYMERIQKVISPILIMLGAKLTMVYRCQLSKGMCEPATDRMFGVANGLTVTPDRNTVFVADPTNKKIAVMKRQDSGWLELDSWIALPFAIDNIEYEETSGQILMGTVPNFLALAKKASDKTVNVPGGMSVLYLEDGAWKTRDILMHDGAKFSPVSVGSRYGSHVILGSPAAKGFLHCKI